MAGVVVSRSGRERTKPGLLRCNNRTKAGFVRCIKGTERDYSLVSSVQNRALCSAEKVQTARITMRDPPPWSERGHAILANQPEGRVDDAEAWAAEGWPVIVDQSAVIGLTPVGAAHAGATWLLTGTHEVLVADAVWGLAEQPPRLADVSAAAAMKRIFIKYLSCDSLVSHALIARASRRCAGANGIRTLGRRDVQIFDEPTALPGRYGMLPCTA
jgi:hypothetical protein